MSTEALLPVDSRTISNRQHIVLRLDQLQRAILEDPERFERLESDRGLSHVRKEVRQLQSALMLAIEQEARAKLKRLTRVGRLLESWQSESELRDILALDQHRREELAIALNLCEDYPAWRAILPRLDEEYERVFSKYEGYFIGQQKDLDTKKTETQKKIKQILPKIEEWRQKLDTMMQMQQQINYDGQKASHGLVTGLGSLATLCVLGYFSGVWGGWLWGMILGYFVFSHLAARFAYLEGEVIQERYDFLCERYPAKTIKSFYQFAKLPRDEKGKIIPPPPDAPAPRPLRFDATRSEALARLLQKDIVAISSQYGQLERQREEHLNYVQYLEGRRQWCQEQLSRIRKLQGLPEEPQPEMTVPLPAEEVLSTSTETSETPAEKPEPVEEIVTIPLKERKVRPAKLPPPDRVS